MNQGGGGGRVGRDGLSQHKHAYTQKHGEVYVFQTPLTVVLGTPGGLTVVCGVRHERFQLPGAWALSCAAALVDA